MPTRITAIYYRQQEFLHQIAAIYESTAGIAHWWIGLTDRGRYPLPCVNTIYQIKKACTLKYIFFSQVGKGTGSGCTVVKSSLNLFGARAFPMRMLGTPMTVVKWWLRLTTSGGKTAAVLPQNSCTIPLLLYVSMTLI